MALIGPLFCQVCNVAIPHENARESHNQGKRHQLTLHAALAEDNDYRATVFSSGWPNGIRKEEIFEFMETFGEIESQFMPISRFWLITKFKDVNVAQRVIQQGKVKFCGRNITFSAKKRPEKQPRPPPQEEDAFEPVLKIMFNQKSFGDEVLSLCSILQPDSELARKKYMHLCADLEKSLRYLFPNAVVHPFGSTITNLAFRDSDVDAYIEVPNRKMFAPSKVFHVEAVVKTRDLLNHTQLFTNIVCIPRAKTPIVRCVHVPTGISCDFNFKNMLGVCNSYFIQFVVGLDPKLKPCLFVLKFWSRLRVAGHSSKKLTSYALTMMFIYYLQQAPYNLPSIRQLQANPAARNMQDGWNGGYDTGRAIDLAALQRASLFELLRGFFALYMSFDYHAMVVCPYLGKSLPKASFASVDVLPEEFAQYRVSFHDQHLKCDTPMCIQDPFEHNRNLVSGIAHRFLEEFVDELKRAHNICEVRNPHLLYNLCSDEYDSVLRHAVRAKMPKARALQFLAPNVPADSIQPSYDLKRAWFQFVDQFLIDVLSDVFMFAVSVRKEEDSHNTPKKMRPMVDLTTDMLDSVRIAATGMYNLWDARGTLRDDPALPASSTLFGQQVAISKYIQGTLLSDVRPTQPIISLTATVEHYLADTHVLVVLEAGDKGANNTYFGAFASCFCKCFSSWLVQHAREKNATFPTAIGKKGGEVRGTEDGVTDNIDAT